MRAKELWEQAVARGHTSAQNNLEAVFGADLQTMKVMEMGTLIEIYGLRKATQHNGKSDFVIAFNRKTMRYTVSLGPPPETEVSLKPQNLKGAEDDERQHCRTPPSMEIMQNT